MIYVNQCLWGEKITLNLPEMNDLVIRKGVDSLTLKELKEIEFFFCSIQDYFQLKRLGITDVSCYDLKVSEFMPATGNYFVNAKNSYFKQICQLNDSDLGNFCRSDSGLKVWSGQILDKGLLQMMQGRLQQDDLMFLAPPLEIVNETRYWVYDSEIVTKSPYGLQQDGHSESEVDEFAREMAHGWGPDAFYTMDIGFVPSMNGWKLIEHNCYSTSGFYNADVGKIVDSVRFHQFPAVKRL